MTALNNEIINTQDILLKGPVTDNKTQPRLANIEDFVTKRFHVFKKTWHRETFNPVFGQLARRIAKDFIPEVFNIHLTRHMLEFLIFSTR